MIAAASSSGVGTAPLYPLVFSVVVRSQLVGRKE